MNRNVRALKNNQNIKNAHSRVLRIATFNAQSGIRSSGYHDYVTKSWQHLLWTPWRQTTLSSIADQLTTYDIVGLQEVDGGGSRGNYIVQTQFLAQKAGFDYWYNQINRRFGSVALHSNGLLSRFAPEQVTRHKLPGLLPGRGMLMASYGEEYANLTVCTAHLALGRKARQKQIDFIIEMLSGRTPVVLMGDFNCGPKSPEMVRLRAESNLIDPAEEIKTFPSWQPKRKLDHILVSPELGINSVNVLDFACSDHLPVAVELILPVDLQEAA